MAEAYDYPWFAIRHLCFFRHSCFVIRHFQWWDSLRSAHPTCPVDSGQLMLPGELATRWTVRMALVGYFVGAALRGGPARSSTQQQVARTVWTLGCLLYLAHVACAFHFYHAWSHAAAYQRTAEQTAAVTGWNWGGGLYLNYAFTVIWLADATWWWRRDDRRTLVWLEIAVQAFLWFMVFNATVVFGHGLIRWFGLAGCVLVAVPWGRILLCRDARRATRL